MYVLLGRHETETFTALPGLSVAAGRTSGVDICVSVTAEVHVSFRRGTAAAAVDDAV